MVSILPYFARGQSGNAISGIITDYKGFWSSSAGNLNPVRPDNSHNLLAFTYKGVTYSTGANDPALVNNGVPFTPGRFEALIVGSTLTASGVTRVGLGEMYDGVRKGSSAHAPSRDLNSYLTDGLNGLDLGTAVANIPFGRLRFPVSIVNKDVVGDGIPDILVTQVANLSAANSGDVYTFYDADNNPIGQNVKVAFDSVEVPALGNWVADFYEASYDPMILYPYFTNSPRAIRLWGADFSEFGITPENCARIAFVEIKLTGNSDLAFLGINSDAIRTDEPQVSLLELKGKLVNEEVHLAWKTLYEKDVEYFEIESSRDEKNFSKIGQESGAGRPSFVCDYTFIDPEVFTGTKYYRVKMVFNDGRYEYSNVVPLTNLKTITYNIFPNPTLDAFTVSHESATGKELLQLIDMNGHVVVQMGIMPGSTATQVDVKPLRNGMYQVIWITEQERSSKKLIIL